MLTKDVFFYLIAGSVADADNVELDCTGKQLQNDLLSLHT